MVKCEETKIYYEQNNIRVSNQLKIINELKDGPRSMTDLSVKLSLSFTAISKIVNELNQAGVVVLEKVSANEKKIGRKPVLVKLNEDVGVLCAIDLSRQNVMVSLATINNKILCEEVVTHPLLIDRACFENIITTIHHLLEHENVKGRKLLGICVAAPGIIDKETGDFIYAPRVENYQHFNMRTFFGDAFGVPVDIFNDVNLGCIAEMKFGCIPPLAENVYFAYIDSITGSALLLNGKLYVGSHGSAGELPDYHVSDGEEKPTNGLLYGMYNVFDLLSQGVKKDPNHPLYHSGQIMSVETIRDLYYADDPLVSRVLDEIARKNAIQLLATEQLLDLDYIVIQGSITSFGEKFKRKLISYYDHYSASSIQATILFSSLNNEANLLGAVYQANNLYWLRRFGDMTAERTTVSDYNVLQFFGNHI